MRTKHDPATEARVVEALAHLEQNPDAKLTAVTQEFKVNREVLRSRLDGHLPPGQKNSKNLKLTA
jgi:hypothetical protein